MSQEWRALRRGESTLVRRREIERAYELFLDNDIQGLQQNSGTVRELVLASWRRSRERNVDPEGGPQNATLTFEELEELRRIHPLAAVFPVIERLLLAEAEDTGFIVAVGDAQGRLLWVDGDRAMRSRAEDIGFVAGTDWSERVVGTSAPGSSLALDHPIQVFGAEHFNRAVHQWSCAATPVHDPVSGAILGVIDITGGETIAEPHVLPLVEATRVAVEAELKLDALRRSLEAEHHNAAQRRSARRQGARGRQSMLVSEQPPRLIVLGREQPMLDTAMGPIELGRRHAEILIALATASHGLSAASLAEAVYGEAGHQETLRAELVRLRRFCSTHQLSFELKSRPYRLSHPLRVDAVDALEALGRGAHRLALASYGGAALVGSDAPVVVELRDELEATLRESMLQFASPEVLFDYAQQWAEDDLAVWQTLLKILPALSPKRARVVAHLDKLETMETFDHPA